MIDAFSLLKRRLIRRNPFAGGRKAGSNFEIIAVAGLRQLPRKGQSARRSMSRRTCFPARVGADCSITWIEAQPRYLRNSPASSFEVAWSRGHCSQIVGHFLAVKNSKDIAGAIEAHYQRFSKYHRQFLGLAQGVEGDTQS